MRRVFALLAAATANFLCQPALAETANRDPYLWLEEIHGARAQQWVHSQNETTLGELRTDPSYRQTRAAADQILNFKDSIPRDQIAGDGVFSFTQSAIHPFGVWRRSGIESYKAGSPGWETLLDLDALNAQQGSRLTWRGAKCLPPDFARCLLFLSDQGAVAVRVREFDSQTRTFVPDGFDVGDATTEAEWIDADTLLIATNWGKGSLTRSGKPRVVKIWSRGLSLREGQTVYEGNPSDLAVTPKTVFSADGKVSLFVIRQLGPTDAQLFHLDESGKAMRITAPASAQFKGMLQRQMVFFLNSDWRIAGQNHLAGSLVSFSLDQYLKNGGALPQIHQAYIADQRSSVTGVAVSSSAVFVSLLENVQGRMNELTFDGQQWLWRRITLPNNGAVEILSASELGQDVLLKYSSFLSPDALYVVGRGREPKPVRQLSARFDARGAEVAQYEAVSADGAKIPYFVVRKTTLLGNAPAPTLLYAYGGFQISTTPWYWSSAGKLWLEKGGAYAIANIRGGGEFGPNWHSAAMGANRQRNFDDLAAVAKDMIARGLTSPPKLGIFGSSQGGLLVAGTFVQHPELFSAVVAQVPLTDMLRYTKLEASKSWTPEYGDPADPRMRDIISQWSPYQNLRAGVKYPSVFFMTSTEDSKVHPGHARKMAAKMEGLGQPVLYYEDHLSGDTSQRAEQLALTFTYFKRVLMD
ncbi:MAG: prolyl oligopeptidase family serine peptidase [Micropepsaceae bacterium]